MSTVTVVPESAIREIVTRENAYEAVKKAFEAIAEDRAEVFPVTFGTGLAPQDVFGVKAGADSAGATVGLKIGSYWPDNGQHDLPAHGSTIILLDPDTGFPMAILGAAYLNGFRTAAANAIAVDYLARKDASVLGVIGAGHQAEHEIRAVAAVRALSRIRIHTRSTGRAEWMARQLDDIDIPFEFTSAQQAVEGADIIATVTPSTQPIVRSEWVAAGAHVCAMGADSKGKQELDTDLVARARWFADLPAQSVAIGEFQHAFAAGIIPSADTICPLGRVTRQPDLGRRDDEEITVFDSSGIAIQDLSVARAMLELARERGLGSTVEL
ncbi:ornithine cyclodeaminase family protein [Elongatibacter sediminis]|uniref:Ornithine cyclodeaminase family protein n=1 Tax=Elongatibacter sediminis TaxID=3119006 RepID=A0AAW9R547_9GAMM